MSLAFLIGRLANGNRQCQCHGLSVTRLLMASESCTDDRDATATSDLRKGNRCIILTREWEKPYPSTCSAFDSFKHKP